MMKEDQELGAKLRGLATQSCVALFDAYDVTLDLSESPWSDVEDRLLCGILGFVGRGVRGTCLLAGTEVAIAGSCPPGGRLRDWVGELTNQLGGRLKSQFLARQVEVALATPIALSGVQIKPLTGATDGRPVVLQTGSASPGADGYVMVWVEAESDDRFVLGPEKQPEDRHGEVLLF